MDRTIHNYHSKDLQTLDQRMLIHKGWLDCQQIMFMHLTNICIYKFWLHSNQCVRKYLEHQSILKHKILKWVMQIHLYK